MSLHQDGRFIQKGTRSARPSCRRSLPQARCAWFSAPMAGHPWLRRRAASPWEPDSILASDPWPADPPRSPVRPRRCPGAARRPAWRRTGPGLLARQTLSRGHERRPTRQSSSRASPSRPFPRHVPGPYPPGSRPRFVLPATAHVPARARPVARLTGALPPAVSGTLLGRARDALEALSTSLGTVGALPASAPCASRPRRLAGVSTPCTPVPGIYGDGAHRERIEERSFISPEPRTE